MVGNKNKHIFKYSGLLLFGCAAFFIIAVLFAAPVKAVTISQINVELVATRGETIEQLVQLYDESFNGVTVYPVVYNFTESPAAEGAVKILTDPADLKPDRAWLKWDKQEVTAANESGSDESESTEANDEADEDTDEETETTVEQEYGQEDIPLKLPVEGTLFDFPYRIEVPQDAEPGTHLLSLVFQLKPAEEIDTGGVAVYIGSNVAVNIFLKVLGATIDDIDMDFQSGVFTNKKEGISSAERKKSFQPKGFFLKPPVDFLLTVYNEGNTHQKPDGNVKVVNDLFGSQYEKLLVNPENRIILPGTDRVFDVPSFGQGFMFGKYRAKIVLLYGDPLGAVEKEISFWIVPLVEILIALAILILIIVIIIVIRRIRKKGRKRREIEQETRIRQKIVDEIKGKKPAPDQKGKPQKQQKKGNDKPQKKKK